MDTYKIKEVRTSDDYLNFARLPFSLYKDNPHWVAPILKEYVKYIKGKDNELLSVGPYKLLLALKNDIIVGRILIFIDRELNEIHNEKNGYFAEYESIDDLNVSKLLLDNASQFCIEHKMTHLKGPVSLPGGEDHRGFMINNFDSTPAIMNVYNFQYYNFLLEDYGFLKYHDCYAYKAKKDDLIDKVDKIKDILPNIAKRFKYKVEHIDLGENLERDLMDIYKILELSLPKEWKDFKPVSLKEIHGIFEQLKPFMDPEFICIARTYDGEPIGFNIALPDYNEILIKLHGKMGILGLLKFLYYKKKIKRIRMFVLFVVPSFRKKGVSAAIYFNCFGNAIKKNYSLLEGSTIWDYNKPMITDIEKFGAKRDIIYRIYIKELKA